MNSSPSDLQLEEMIKSAVNSSGPLPPDEKFSLLISALRELQERRKADSEPVCFVSERNLANLTKHQVSVYVKAEPVMVRPVALYLHAQPVPVVPDRMTAIVKDEAEYVEGWNACRAAMLNGGKP
ncbi:hypothetical protein WDQ77_001065 [Klebsiella variicola]